MKGRAAELLRLRWRVAEGWLRHNRGRALAFGAAALVALAGALGAVYGLGVATFVVVVYGTLFSAFVAVGLQPFPARPELEVGFWKDGRITQLIQIEPDEERRPIDAPACIRERTQAARATVTPKEPPPQADPFRGLPVSMTEPYEHSLRRFESELGEYQAELTGWLEAYESRCWPNYSKVSTRIATRNYGETVAEGITLRVALPKGIVPLARTDKLSLDPPPDPPEFKRKSLAAGLDYASLLRSSVPLRIEPQDISQHSFVRERDHVVVEFRIARLTHGLTDRSDVIHLLPNKPGVYEAAWRAHVGNLREPTQGAMRVEVDPAPETAAPLTTIAEVVASGYVPILHEPRD
jgi:hypothetical protein